MTRRSAPADEPSRTPGTLPVNSLPSMPTVELKACPIATTLGSLGRKWTLPILRDIAFFPDVSFSFILKANKGLGPRTLSIRLKQLVHDGLVRKENHETDPRHPRYKLTAKGLEVWPILASLFQFGIRNFPQIIFEDKRSRDLAEVYPNDASLMLGPLANFARTAAAPPGTATPHRPSDSVSQDRPGRK